MNGGTLVRSWKVVALAIIAAFLLVACERPDPYTVAAAAPVLVPTDVMSPEPTATSAPVQVNVTILMPTTIAAGQNPLQILPESVQVVVVTPTPEATEAAALSQTTIEPTPYPANFYMGWAWSDGLVIKDNDNVFVSSKGAHLRDRPAPDGKRIGLVVGFAEVFVVGQSYCGYTPVMAHQGNMLTMTTPRPDVVQPASMTEQQPASPLFAVQQGTTSGWAHIGSLVIMDESSVTPGQFGINLRQEPCKYAINLGFVPADGLMTITGPPSGDYIPVRVNNDVIQFPLSAERPLQLEPAANPGNVAVPTRQPPDIP
jgi:hypothetical protein